jgi:hypothetical protein
LSSIGAGQGIAQVTTTKEQTDCAHTRTFHAGATAGGEPFAAGARGCVLRRFVLQTEHIFLESSLPGMDLFPVHRR